MLRQGIGDDEDILRATDMKIGEMHASVFGYGDVNPCNVVAQWSHHSLVQKT